MFLKNMSSFFMRDGEIRFVRVLIALLSGQLALFCLGALFYLSSSKLSIPFDIYVDFFYSEILKNGIIMSTFFYGVISYMFVVRYNKATIHSYGMNNPKKPALTLLAFIVYSFYMLFDSGIFTFDNETLFIKEHYYFYIIFLMAIVNMANSFSILMLISSSNVNEKEFPKMLGVITDSFKLVYSFFVFFVLFFVVAKYSMSITFSFNYYINIFFTVIMCAIFLASLFKTLVSVEDRLEKSFSKMNEEYKNIIKKNLNSVEMFKKAGVIDKLTISKVRISHSSVRYVVDDIKKIGDYEQIFLARYTDDHNILSAYFDKEGNLLAEDARKKETEKDKAEEKEE